MPTHPPADASIANASHVIPTVGMKVVYRGIHGMKHLGILKSWTAPDFRNPSGTMTVRMTKAFHDKPPGYVVECSPTFTSRRPSAWALRRGFVPATDWNLFAPVA